MENDEIGYYRRKLAKNYPTLRDQFAMATLSGLLDGTQVVTSGTAKAIAEDAYKMADAMLAERAKGEQ